MYFRGAICTAVRWWLTFLRNRLGVHEPSRFRNAKLMLHGKGRRHTPRGYIFVWFSISFSISRHCCGCSRVLFQPRIPSTRALEAHFWISGGIRHRVYCSQYQEKDRMSKKTICSMLDLGRDRSIICSWASAGCATRTYAPITTALNDLPRTGDQPRGFISSYRAKPRFILCSVDCSERL